MAVTSYFKNALLDFAIEQAVERQRSVYDVMQALQSARMREVEKGRITISYGDGTSNSASTLITGTQAVTPAQIVEAWAELRQLYRTIKRALTTDSVPEPGQDLVLDELRAQLDNPPLEAYGDFSEIKLLRNYNVIE